MLTRQKVGPNAALAQQKQWVDAKYLRRHTAKSTSGTTARGAEVPTARPSRARALDRVLIDVLTDTRQVAAGEQLVDLVDQVRSLLEVVAEGLDRRSVSLQRPHLRSEPDWRTGNRGRPTPHPEVAASHVCAEAECGSAAPAGRRRTPTPGNPCASTAVAIKVVVDIGQLAPRSAGRQFAAP